jgi:Fic family protein
MGFRTKGGFVGEHDRSSGEPMPDHISAKAEDLTILIEGLISTNNLLINSELNPVLAASIIAFGFVFIHPFEDGNGRIHRYLIHHMLAKKRFSDQGIVFPVSASILDHIDDYRIVLESYSRPLLDFIEWDETDDHNVKVTNTTFDYYRFFDATKQAEFHFDEFRIFLEEEFEMPDKMISLLVGFLQQNNGVLSERAKEKEFLTLTNNEITKIETKYKVIFEKSAQ